MADQPDDHNGGDHDADDVYPSVRDVLARGTIGILSADLCAVIVIVSSVL
jgi:hypothetical protein